MNYGFKKENHVNDFTTASQFARQAKELKMGGSKRMQKGRRGNKLNSGEDGTPKVHKQTNRAH